MRDSKDKLQSQLMKYSYLAFCGILLLVWVATANGQRSTLKSKTVRASSGEVQQPLYREYRGVRLGMTMEEARAKFGVAELKSDEMDFYIVSPGETALIAYDTSHKVVAISVDYTGGVGAPDYKTVVGTGLLERPDGSLYMKVEYAEGFWVSYNKSAGTVPVVSITIQVSP